MRIDALVLAAGSGTRFGGPVAKAFVELGGVPLVLRAARTAAAAAGRLVVVADTRLLEATSALLQELGDVRVVAGGPTRQESSRLGLEALPGADDDIVIVHDAARPLSTIESFRRVVAAVEAGAAAATAAIASSDTMAILEDDRIVAVPDRSAIARVQTPQAFRRGVLWRAHQAAAAAGDVSSTDDCGLVLRYDPDAAIVVVAGDERNLKITRPADLELAGRLLAGG